MKLSSAQLSQTLHQFGAEVLPDNHPLVPQLNELFGDHTFFLDSKGLNIVEPTDHLEARAHAARVVNLATWGDASRTSLAPHEPEPTNSFIELELEHGTH